MTTATVVPSSTPRATTPTAISRTPSAATPTTTPVAQGVLPADDMALAAALLNAVNAFRATDGCPALTRDPLVESVAQAHAADLAATRRIDHRGLDGSTLDERLARAGYVGQYSGENIAAGFATADEVISIWTEGDENPDGEHRLNLLICSYRIAGIGLARADDGYPYWVLNMAR